jgi:hypothetical protein
MNYTFNNSSIVSVNSGTIVLNVSGKTRTFADAKLVSAVDGKIVLDLPEHAKENGSYLVIQINDKTERIFIVNPYRKCCIDYHVSQCSGMLHYTDFWANNSPIRNATPEEIQELNDQLAAEEKCWNPDTMQIEKLRWKPKYHETYYFLDLFPLDPSIRTHQWVDDHIDNGYYKTNNCFKTEEEAKEKLEQIKKLLLEV